MKKENGTVPPFNPMRHNAEQFDPARTQSTHPKHFS